MPSKGELMAKSLPYNAADALGYDPLTSFTAAGTTSQANSTVLTACFANVATNSPNNGVIIAAPFGRSFVYNAGPNTLLVYPPVGGTFVGQALNAPINVATGSVLSVEGDGLNYGFNIGS